MGWVRKMRFLFVFKRKWPRKQIFLIPNKPKLGSHVVISTSTPQKLTRLCDAFRPSMTSSPSTALDLMPLRLQKRKKGGKIAMGIWMEEILIIRKRNLWKQNLVRILEQGYEFILTFKVFWKIMLVSSSRFSCYLGNIL